MTTATRRYIMLLAACLVAGAVGVATASAGISAVILGDGDDATARRAQAPLGYSKQPTIEPSPKPDSSTPTEQPQPRGGTKPGTVANPRGSGAPVTAGPGAGGSGGKLPFTGFLAIPLLAAALALLGAGVVTRRRATT